MTGKQTAVLWIGLLIVFANLAMKWSEVRNVIFSGAQFTPSNPSGSSAPPFSGGLPWWIPKWPGTQIPLVSQTTTNSSASSSQGKQVV